MGTSEICFRQGGYKRIYKEDVSEVSTVKGYSESDWLAMEQLRARTTDTRDTIGQIAETFISECAKVGQIRRRVRTRPDEQSDSDRMGMERIIPAKTRLSVFPIPAPGCVGCCLSGWPCARILPQL